MVRMKEVDIYETADQDISRKGEQIIICQVRNVLEEVRQNQANKTILMKRVE